MDDKFHAIVQLLQASKFEDIENKYLINEISFDHIRDSVHGDTLLHYFFRHLEDFPSMSGKKFSFLPNCFFRCDHLNNENKTALHILLEFNPDYINYFIYTKDKGFSFFETYGNTISILEMMISIDHINAFKSLIGEYKLDYIDQFYYDKSLCFSIKYESLKILKLLVSKDIADFETLFNKFLNNFKAPIDETNENTANYQFYKSIKNSNKKIFKTIFNSNSNKSNNKKLTVNMLYYCTDDSFCIYLSNFVKFDKIPEIKDSNISSRIFELVKDINSNVYNSRLIIHQAVINDDFELIRRIPTIMYDSQDFYGDTPLIYALEHDKCDMAKYLIKNGDVDFCHLGRKTTPLHLAVKGRIEILRKMLSLVNKKKYKRKFDINVKDREGNTPLLAPFYSKNNKSIKTESINTECLKLILQNGADITANDLEGKNILYHSINNWNIVKFDFVEFILSNNDLNLSKSSSCLLLETLYNQKQNDKINLILDRFGIDPEFMKYIFSKYVISNMNKVYSLLKQKDIKIDYFFDCLKVANEKVITTMLTTIDGLLFYVDSNDNNQTVLFILANLQINRLNYLNSILITIFEAVIKNNRKDFLLIKDKKNGDNFLQVALRKRNEKLINVINEIFQKDSNNKICEHFVDDIDNLWSLINDLIYQQNNNEMNSVELRVSLFYDLGNIFKLDIFEKEPSYEELKKFLEKVQNPNISQNNEELVIKYVKYEKFNEDEIIEILKLFDKYHCNFTKNQKEVDIENDDDDIDEDYAALICLNRSFYNAFLFLLNHGGVGSYVDNILNLASKEKLILDKKLKKILDNYMNYYRIVGDFKRVIDFSCKIQQFVDSTINSSNKLKVIDKKEENFWPIISIVQRFHTFNIHFSFIFNLIQKNLTFESPIPELFDVFLPIFDEIYGQFHEKIRDISLIYSSSGSSLEIASTESWMSQASDYANKVSNFMEKLQKLSEMNPNEEMKKKLDKIRRKCRDLINGIIIYSLEINNLKNLIKNHKITYSIQTNFNFSNLPNCLRFEMAKIIEPVDFDFNLSYHKNRYSKVLLICTDKNIVFCSIDSNEIRVFYETSIFTCFHVFIPSTSKTFPKLRFFTKDGKIEIQQFDFLNGFRGIHKFIEEIVDNFNESLINEWNSIRNSVVENDDCKDEAVVYISYVDADSHRVVQGDFNFNKKADINDVKSFGSILIGENVDNSMKNSWILSLNPLI